MLEKFSEQLGLLVHQWLDHKSGQEPITHKLFCNKNMSSRKIDDPHQMQSKQTENVAEVESQKCKVICYCVGLTWSSSGIKISNRALLTLLLYKEKRKESLISQNMTLGPVDRQIKNQTIVNHVIINQPARKTERVLCHN